MGDALSSVCLGVLIYTIENGEIVWFREKYLKNLKKCGEGKDLEEIADLKF